MVAGVQTFGPFFHCFSQEHEQEAGLEVEQPGFKPLSIWDVTGYTTNLVSLTTALSSFTIHTVTDTKYKVIIIKTYSLST